MTGVIRGDGTEGGEEGKGEGEERGEEGGEEERKLLRTGRDDIKGSITYRRSIRGPKKDTVKERL